MSELFDSHATLECNGLMLFFEITNQHIKQTCSDRSCPLLICDVVDHVVVDLTRAHFSQSPKNQSHVLRRFR